MPRVYKGLILFSFKDYLQEGTDGGLTIFDIDDTLFHTFAMIKVVKDGQEIKKLTNQEFNVYHLQPGESYDFGEFKNAKFFRETSKPIDKMLNKLRAILDNIQNNPNSKMIIITARDDFDDKHEFLRTFRDHGIDIDKIYVERAAKWGTGPSAPLKCKIIAKYIDTFNFKRVRLFDDAMSNLTAMLAMKKDYPDVSFQAYHAQHDGSVKTIKSE
jgi:hypothetical protein